MASRYLQKYYLPENFQDVLSELVREVLRAQPEDIIEFLANYCEARAQGKEYQYQSIYNVKKREIPEQPTYEYYQSMEERAKMLVQSSNKQEVVMQPTKNNTKRTLLDEIPEPASLRDDNSIINNANEKNIGTDDQYQQEEQQQNNDNNNNQEQQSEQQEKEQEQRSQSAQSQGRVSNATSHPEEKGIGKQFVGELYSSAIQNLQKSGLNEQEQAEVKAQFEFSKEVEENQEQFEQAARFIQGKYKQQKAKDEKQN